MTLPDDLAEAVDSYLWSQEVPPALTAVVQTALRKYLREQGFLQVRRPLKIRPAKPRKRVKRRDRESRPVPGGH